MREGFGWPAAGLREVGKGKGCRNYEMEVEIGRRGFPAPGEAET